ncbi:MAG: PLP-dependent aminotransferase family protein, partial [Verrucomicrobiota bacterium]
DTSLESDFCAACIEAGVLYVPGDLCYSSRQPRNHIRASLGSLSPEPLAEAARRFVQVALNLN